MKTAVVIVDSLAPQPECIARAAEVLRSGGLVAFPTETVYGLGANALDGTAVGRIFAAKGRPPNNPLIVHVVDAGGAEAVAAAWPPTAAILAARFWPGPLTLVLPRRPKVPDAVTAGGSTVAVRVPAHPVARALLQASGLSLAAPSANRSTRLSPTRAEHVLNDLDGRIDLILDAGPTPGGIESTVLDLTTDPPRLLRPGLVSPEQLQAVIGPILLAAPRAASPDAPLPSPGLLERHYAPRTPLECISSARQRVEQLMGEGQRVGWLALGDGGPPPPRVIIRVLPRDPAGYAAVLYAALHELDALGLDRIIADLPPDTPEWLAVRDRLRRASG